MSTTQQQPADFIDGYFTRNYPNVAKNTINSGDLLYVDQSTFDVKPLDTDAHAAYFCGISRDTYPILPELNTIVPFHGNGVRRVGVVPLVLKNSDTANPGTSVYIGSTAQIVTSATAGNSHAVATLYNNPDGTYASGVTGDGVTKYLFVLNVQL
jgi:hypothetical protein